MKTSPPPLVFPHIESRKSPLSGVTSPTPSDQQPVYEPWRETGMMKKSYGKWWLWWGRKCLAISLWMEDKITQCAGHKQCPIAPSSRKWFNLDNLIFPMLLLWWSLWSLLAEPQVSTTGVSNSNSDLPTRFRNDRNWLSLMKIWLPLPLSSCPHIAEAGAQLPPTIIIIIVTTMLLAILGEDHRAGRLEEICLWKLL